MICVRDWWELMTEWLLPAAVATVVLTGTIVMFAAVITKLGSDGKDTKRRSARVLQTVAWYGYECGRTGQDSYWMLTNLDKIITEK